MSSTMNGFHSFTPSSTHDAGTPDLGSDGLPTPPLPCPDTVPGLPGATGSGGPRTSRLPLGGGFPQLKSGSGGVTDVSEPTDTGLVDDIVVQFDARLVQLGEHRVKIADAEVHHDLLLRLPEVAAVLRERCPHGRTGFLVPRNVALCAAADTEMLRVPRGDPFLVARPEEDSADTLTRSTAPPLASLVGAPSQCHQVRPRSHRARPDH